MAAEATKVEGPFEIHDFTVAVGGAGTSIEQGTLMQFSNPRTAIDSSGDGVAFAGIAATEHTGDVGKTELGLWTTGTFIMKAVAVIGDEGAIDAGDLCVVSGVNLIRAAEAGDLLTGAIVGKALEDIAAGTTGEVKLLGV